MVVPTPATLLLLATTVVCAEALVTTETAVRCGTMALSAGATEAVGAPGTGLIAVETVALKMSRVSAICADALLT